MRLEIAMKSYFNDKQRHTEEANRVFKEYTSSQLWQLILRWIVEAYLNSHLLHSEEFIGVTDNSLQEPL